MTSHDLSHQPSLKEQSFLQKWNGFSTTHSPKIHPPQLTLSGLVGIPVL
ncbi:MAG: hypothetical protein ACOC35_02610 [Promethearchaeia archaeon]